MEEKRYKLENLKPREFEVLAANYARIHSSKEKWLLTKSSGDNNRDFELTVEEFHKWGEAKSTKDRKKGVSKTRWDPTLVSAVLHNKVDEIYLITSGWISLEYIVRAESFKQKNIKTIYYINRILLDTWLEEDFDIESLSNFNESLKDKELKAIMKSLDKIEIKNDKVKDGCLINFYNAFANDNLTIQTELKKNVYYQLNIVFFASKEEKVKIILPKTFKLISEINYKNLSTYQSKTQQLSINTEDKVKNCIDVILTLGYNQVKAYGLFENSDVKRVEIGVLCDNKKFAKNKRLTLKDNLIIDIDENLTEIEKLINENFVSGENKVKYTNGIGFNAISRKDFFERGYSFAFTNSASENAKILCRLLTLLLINIDYKDVDDVIIDECLRNEINFYPFWLNELMIGTSNTVFALSVMQNFEKVTHYLNENSFTITEKSILYFNNCLLLSEEMQLVFEQIKKIFLTNANSSIFIVDKADFNYIDLLNYVDNIDSLQKNENEIVDCLLDTTADLNLRYQIATKAGDIYYNKTDFYKAKFYYDIGNSISSAQNDILLDFRYADCLNHCGSMIQAKKIFQAIADKSSDPTLGDKINIFLEAATEVFNISFWRMETDDLVAKIDSFLEKNNNQLNQKTDDKRAKYSYYNCLNRKMVTLYLIEDYDNAQLTFKQYIDASKKDNYNNYLAFAYMDSARGLYMENIAEAKLRLDIAAEKLKKLFNKGEEKRRYYDCLVEIEFVNYITDFVNDKSPKLDNLLNAVYIVKKHGYNNMLIKCYLKLAACYLTKLKFEKTSQYLENVRLSCDFNENPRVSKIYHEIELNMKKLKKELNINKYDKAKKYVSFKLNFNVSEKVKINCDSNAFIELDPRIW